MNEVLVSVRMPETLFFKLKELAEKEHCLDVSEELRSIIRKNWLKAANPELFEIKKLKDGILNEVKKKSKNEITKKVIEELNDIKKRIEEDRKK